MWRGIIAGRCFGGTVASACPVGESGNTRLSMGRCCIIGTRMVLTMR
jgi:hypothetical protein